jgi:hypothetical protein
LWQDFVPRQNWTQYDNMKYLNEISQQSYQLQIFNPGPRLLSIMKTASVEITTVVQTKESKGVIL